ncbi:MAG: LuxR C-terminal-related transcriptional regulator [Tannerellaceae bacterium]
MDEEKYKLQLDIDEFLTRSNYPQDINREDLEESTADFLRSSIVCADALQKAMIITCANKSNVYYMSDSFFELTGYTRKEAEVYGPNFITHLMKKADLEILPEIREMARHEIYSQRSRNLKRHLFHMIQYSYQLQRKDGKWITIECSAYPDCFIGNTPYFVISYIKQTHRKERLSIQVYFFRENIRMIYNPAKHKFIYADKIQLKDVEYAILQLTATGHKEHQIAKKTDLDHNSIKYYKKNIMKKLSVNSMPEAIYYALKNEIL